jgi:dihydrofolate reductase
MTIISMIAAIDETGGLGINNQLLCYLPADLQHFKTITMGKPIIMGRKTFASIGKPLPGRTNVVLSHSPSFMAGVSVVDSLSRAINNHETADEIMIIGGAEVFAQAMGVASRLYITRIHHHFNADVFFPEIDKSVWSCQSKEFRQHDDKNEYDMTFYTYERK